MDSLDLEGLFWPVDAPAARIPGRLRFDVEHGAELDLFGAFQGLEGMMTDESIPVRILGVAGKKVLTLDNCYPSGSKLETPGIYRERYRPSLILAGAHFEESEPLEFSAVTVRTRHLEHWVGQSGIVLEMTEQTDSREIAQIRLTHTPLGKSMVSSSPYDVELGFTWRLRGDHVVESVVEQGCYLRLTSPDRRPLDAFLKAAMSLQHLITLGVDSSAPIESLGFWHPDITRQIADKVIHETIHLYAQLQGSDVSPSSRTPHRHDMLFSFNDIGGLEGIGRWIQAAEKLEPVVGALLSHRYVPRMYTDNRLQNLVFAAEALHRLEFRNNVLPRAEFRERLREISAAVPEEYRLWLREQLQYSNEPHLKQRLLDLADYAGNSFTRLVGDVAGWANAVKDARNQSVHLTPRRRRVSSKRPSLYLLCESAYFLVALCVLRKSGVSEATLAGVEQHHRYTWLADQLALTFGSR